MGDSKKIAIYGAGGFGRETRLLIDQINADAQLWEFVGFFDDNKVDSVLGGISKLNEYSSPIAIVVAIADSNIRKKVVNSIDNKNVSFATLIHPSVIYEKEHVKISEGTIITALSVLTTNISIAKHTIINLATTIGHDNQIGNYCSIMPGVHLSGNIRVGEGVLIGTGARILQNLNIGGWSKVGAGAVVVKDVKENTTVVGVPAKQVVKEIN